MYCLLLGNSLGVFTDAAAVNGNGFTFDGNGPFYWVSVIDSQARPIPLALPG